jgi:hypothetical protein
MRKGQVILDAETWAASGGTIGIFGRLFKGRLSIVSRELTATEREALDKALADAGA